MLQINLTNQERDNLLAFLTGKGRLNLSGDEAFEFVNIVNKISNAKEKEVKEADTVVEE